MQCGNTILLSLWHVRKAPESIWEPVHYLAIHYMTIFDAKFLKTISKSNFNGSIFPDSAVFTFIPLVTGWSYVIFFQYLCLIQSLPLLKTLFLCKSHRTPLTRHSLPILLYCVFLSSSEHYSRFCWSMVCIRAPLLSVIFPFLI